MPPRGALKVAGYAVLGALLAVLYANWGRLETQLQLTVEHHAQTGHALGALTTVTVYPNGASIGGVEVQVSADVLGRKNMTELATYFAQFVRYDTRVEPEDAPTEIEGAAAKPKPKRALPPRLYTGAGQRVRSFADLTSGARLYVVGPRLQFIWPFVERGHRVELQWPGIEREVAEDEEEDEDEPAPIILESLSDSPRIFRIHNFVTQDHVDQLEQLRLRLAPETAAAGAHRSSLLMRDEQSSISLEMRQRAFQVLRLGKFRDALSPAMELMRYEPTQAYMAHHDAVAFDGNSARFLDPAKGGCNAFATIVTYLSDVELGGQTVFPALDPEDPVDPADPEGGHDGASDADAAAEYEARGFPLFSQQSWEVAMLRQCTTRFVVTPRKFDALLFYNQKSNSEIDAKALHGGCPVLEGIKDTATVRIMNDCATTAPVNPKASDIGMAKAAAASAAQAAQAAAAAAAGTAPISSIFRLTFRSLFAKPADVFMGETKVRTLRPNGLASFMSENGQQWRVKYGDQVLVEYSSTAQAGDKQFVVVPAEAPPASA